MQKDLASFETRLAPAEDFFFTWLPRVIVAATLLGAAWIDDAPPLEVVAILVGIYVVARIVWQFNALLSAAPFQNRILNAFFVLGMFILLAGTFLIIVTFVDRIASSVVG